MCITAVSLSLCPTPQAAAHQVARHVFCEFSGGDSCQIPAFAGGIFGKSCHRCRGVGARVGEIGSGAERTRDA